MVLLGFLSSMMSPTLLAVVCLASGTVLAAYDKPTYKLENAENLFKHFVEEHKKIYSHEEYTERLEIFKETLKDINERNDMFPDTVFTVNHFADLKPHEMQQYRGFELPDKNITEGQLAAGIKIAPKAFDWRTKNAVSPVKTQGNCASCYIFSAVGNIEGQYAIKHGQCLSLSEGQALDCLDSASCSPGYMAPIMRELAAKKKKLEKEIDYPYKPAKMPCHEDVSKGVVQVLKGEDMSFYDEENLKTALYNYGPLSMALNDQDLPFYSSGILDPNKCTGARVNHAVLLVGYGEEKGKKYWILKNSWGSGWGEQGYVRLVRGVNACGFGSYAAASTVL